MSPTDYEGSATYPVSCYKREQSLREGLGNGLADLKIINLYVRIEIMGMGE